MKFVSRIILALALLGMVACGETPQEPCPSETIYIPAMTKAGGKIIIRLERGDLNNPDNYFTESEMEEMRQNDKQDESKWKS